MRLAGIIMAGYCLCKSFGNLAKFAAIRRPSSLVSSLAAERPRPERPPRGGHGSMIARG